MAFKKIFTSIYWTKNNAYFFIVLKKKGKRELKSENSNTKKHEGRRLEHKYM